MSGGGHFRHHAPNLPRRFSKTQLEVPILLLTGYSGIFKSVWGEIIKMSTKERASKIKYRNRSACVIASLMALIVSGCATMLSGADQEVTFRSKPAGARVTVTSFSQDRNYIVESPRTLRLNRKKNYIATFELPGYHTQTFPVSSEFGDALAGSVLGNIILGGGIGLLIDAGTGSNKNLPENIELELTKSGEPAPLNAFSTEEVLEKIRVVSAERAAKLERRRERVKEYGHNRSPHMNVGPSSVDVCEVFQCVEQKKAKRPEKCRNRKMDRACRKR